MIQEDLSPEQVAKRLELEGEFRISHKTIYQRIYADKRNEGNLHQHLRRQKVRRKRYASGQDRRGVINNRVSIDERPEIVSEKSCIGDWEGDTIIGKNHKGGLVTLAEHKSRYVLAGHICSKQARASPVSLQTYWPLTKINATPLLLIMKRSFRNTRK